MSPPTKFDPATLPVANADESGVAEKPIKPPTRSLVPVTFPVA